MELACGLTRPDAGSVRLPGGRPVPRGLRSAIRAGVALVSGDRRRLGLMLDKPIWENIAQIRAVGLAAAGPVVKSGDLRARAREQVRQLRIRSASVDQDVGGLSGGNQQKVVFAKWLDAAPSVVLLDDPTRGVDVGAKAEMHALIKSTAQAGVPVMLCSTDIDELATLCDRVVVIHQGRATTTLSGDELTTHAVLEAMNTGGLAGAATG
jgi:ABC-type sugar transport system ATPase subunit